VSTLGIVARVSTPLDLHQIYLQPHGSNTTVLQHSNNVCPLLGLWAESSLPARAPPEQVMQGYVLEPLFDGYSDYDEAVAG
jgi:hypothetical protein